MSKAIGAILILAGIAGGLYLGIWVCFIGGIVDFINGLRSNPMDAMKIAIGLVKFFSASLVGWLSFLVCSAIGIALLE